MNGLDAWLHTCNGPFSHVLTPGSAGTSNSDYAFQPVNLDSVDFLLEQSYRLLGITAHGQRSDVINHCSDAIRCAGKVEHGNCRRLRPLSAPSIPSRPDIPHDLTLFGRKIDLYVSNAGKCAVCGSGMADDDDVMFTQCRRWSTCRPAAAADVDGGPTGRFSTNDDFDERGRSLTGTDEPGFAKRLLRSSHMTSLNVGRNTSAVCRCHHAGNGRNLVAENDCYKTSIEIGAEEEIRDTTKTGNSSASLPVDPPAVSNPSLLLTLRKYDEIRRESQVAKESIYGQFESRARRRVDSLFKSFRFTSPTENGDKITRGNKEDSSTTLTSTNKQSGLSKTASLSAPTSKPEVVVRDRGRQHSHELTSKVKPALAWQLGPSGCSGGESKRNRLKSHNDFVKCDTPLDVFVKDTTSLQFGPITAISDINGEAEMMYEKVPFDSGCTSQLNERCVANGNSSLLNYGGSPSTLSGLSITELLANFDDIRLAGLKARQQNCYDYQQQRRRRGSSRYKQPPVG